jgi:hypothetical protein
MAALNAHRSPLQVVVNTTLLVTAGRQDGRERAAAGHENLLTPFGRSAVIHPQGTGDVRSVTSESISTEHEGAEWPRIVRPADGRTR